VVPSLGVGGGNGKLCEVETAAAESGEGFQVGDWCGSKPMHAGPPFPPVVPEPVLGRVWSLFQRGFGQARPPLISMGGDPTGIVDQVHWLTWGGPRAIAGGVGSYDPPGKIVADSLLTPATVVAFHLGTCDGIVAYTAIEWYYPKHGGRFDPHSYIN